METGRRISQCSQEIGSVPPCPTVFLAQNGVDSVTDGRETAPPLVRDRLDL